MILRKSKAFEQEQIYAGI